MELKLRKPLTKVNMNYNHFCFMLHTLAEERNITTDSWTVHPSTNGRRIQIKDGSKTVAVWRDDKEPCSGLIYTIYFTTKTL